MKTPRSEKDDQAYFSVPNSETPRKSKTVDRRKTPEKVEKVETPPRPVAKKYKKEKPPVKPPTPEQKVKTPKKKKEKKPMKKKLWPRAFAVYAFIALQKETKQKMDEWR